MAWTGGDPELRRHIERVAAQRRALPPGGPVIGDYRFDIECGRAAGSHTVLLTHPHDPKTYTNTEQADLLLSSLADYPLLLAWLEAR